MNENGFTVFGFGFLILLVLVSCAPALAQHANESLGGTFDTPAGATITKAIVVRIAQRKRERRLASGRSGPSSGPAQPVAKLNETSVLFRPTGTQLKTREIANVIDAGNPELFKLLTALLEEFDKGARTAGHPNDLALAMSFFLANNASIYHDAGEPSDPQMVELRDTIAEALVEGNALSSMTDRKKQEMYESLVLFTGLALATYHEGKQGGNSETVKASQQLAGQNLLAVMGISADRISFTNQGLNIETKAAAVTSTPSQSNNEPRISRDAATLSNSDFLDGDPFPDKPRVQPQQPLIGRLRKTITMADLAGKWEKGGASIMEYVNSSSSTSTSVSFTRRDYTVRADGSYRSESQSRASNTTIRENDSGSIILSGGLIIVRSAKLPEMRYQFVSYMIQPNGAVVLSLVYLGDKPEWTGDELRGNCDHAQGYISCMGGEEWVRIP